MSTTAQDISTTLTQQERANLSESDQIAELLLGEEGSDLEDEDGEETQAAASNQEESEESNEESDAESEGEEKTELEAIAEEDLTWEGALGAEEGQLSFDEDGNVTGFVTKVNGEVETVDAKTLIAGFQNNKANTKKAQEHAEQVKAFEAQTEQVKQAYASKLGSVDTLTKYFEKQLIAEFDNVDWDKLKNEDPAMYAANRLDFQSKAEELQRIQDAIQKDTEAEAQAYQKEVLENQQVYLKQQFETMLIKNPEWQNKEVRDEAQASFRNFVNEQYGFTEAEFESVFDARLIEMIKDAQRYHNAAKVSSKKRNKPVPRFQKPVGGQKRKTPSKLEKLTAASKKASGQQKRDLQSSAVAELLMGNE